MLPIIAALLNAGLPILGNAVLTKGKEFVEEKLGTKLPEASEIFGPAQNPETLLALRQLEVNHEEKLLEMALESKKLETEDYKIQIADVDSARKREIELAKASIHPWWVPSFQNFLSTLIIVGSGWILIMSNDTDIRLVAATSIASIIGYYYGSTKKSGEKDSTIQTLAGVKSGTS